MHLLNTYCVLGIVQSAEKGTQGPFHTEFMVHGADTRTSTRSHAVTVGREAPSWGKGGERVGDQGKLLGRSSL